MKFFTHRVQLIILALWIAAILLIFKFITDRSVAAVVAGTGFVVWPILFLIHDFRYTIKTKTSWIHQLGCLQFLVLFAVPLFLLRVLNWGVPFSELSLIGIKAMTLHQYSNMSYLLMTLAIAYANFEDRRNKNRWS